MRVRVPSALFRRRLKAGPLAVTQLIGVRLPAPEPWWRSSAGQSAVPSRQRSRVRTSSSPPGTRIAQRQSTPLTWGRSPVAAVRKTVALASVVRFHPGALMLLWSRRIGRCPPKAEIAGSSPAGSAAAHGSLAWEAVRKTAVARFDSGVRLHGPWSSGQDGGPLNRKRAFESRRADRCSRLRTDAPVAA
jgi:hypothetical protein